MSCGADLLADAGAHERRPHAVQELLAAPLGLLQAQGQGSQIVLGDDVRHDRGGVDGTVDGVGDGSRRGGGVSASHGRARADGAEVQDDDGVRGEPAAGLLLHVVGHLGVREAEAGILGELGLRHRDQAPR